MLTLLRSDFYRLFRSRAFYICSAVAVFLLSGSAFLQNWAIRLMSMSDNGIALPPLFTDGLSYGLTAFSDGSVHLFMAIFIAIFVTSEFVHGTMKNIVSKGFPRYQVYLSKLITMAVASYLMMILMFIFATISATIITGTIGTVSVSLLGDALLMICVEALLHGALASIFVMIAMVIRNSGGTIAINIIGVVSFSPLVYQLLELLFRNKIKFTQYSLRNNITLFYQNLNPAGEDILRAVIVGIGFLVVTTVLGVLAFQKSDIK